MVNSIYSPTTSFFPRVGVLDDAFTEVGPSSYLGVFSLTKDERICRKYRDCAIPFYEYAFSVIGFHLCLIVFEIEVLKNLVMSPLQLHHVMYIKVN